MIADLWCAHSTYTLSQELQQAKQVTLYEFFGYFPDERRLQLALARDVREMRNAIHAEGLDELRVFRIGAVDDHKVDLGAITLFEALHAWGHLAAADTLARADGQMSGAVVVGAWSVQAYPWRIEFDDRAAAAGKGRGQRWRLCLELAQEHERIERVHALVGVE